MSKLPRFLICLILGTSGTLRAAAPNDAFDNAIDLGSVAEWSAVVDTVAATVQVGEPSHPGFFSDYGSLWWTWTAPAEGGELELITEGSMAMHVYQGGQLGDLVRIDTTTTDLPANRRHITPGATYRLMVGANRAATRAGFVFHPRPPNDDFANATDLGNAFPRTVTARNDAATREPGEPEHWTSSEGGSRWWSWISPADGVVSLEMPNAPFSGWVLAAYRGTELSDLAWVGRVFSQTPNSTMFRVSAGETLHLALANNNPAKRDGTTFRIDMRELVNNDSPENALDLGVVGSASFTGDTTAASPDPGAGLLPAIWWRWSPPVNGRVTIGFAESGTPGYLGLFRLLPDGGRQPVATHYHPIREYCRADESYLIRLQGFQGVPVAIELSHAPAPVNDDLADALPLPFSRTEIDFANAGAEPGEPFDPAARSVWWRWTAPADGALLAEGSLFADSAESATTPADLTPVADAPNAAGRRAVTAGQRYLLANEIGPLSDPPLVETIDPVFVPLTSGNGAFADAAPLGDSAHGRAFADMADGISEPGEPEPAGASLWWTWTAPFDGIVTVELNDWESAFSDPTNAVRLFTGTSPDALTAIDPTPGWSSFNKVRAFTVSGGTTYHLRFNGIPGLFDFRYDAFPLPHANDAFAAATDLGSVTSHEETLIFSGATEEDGEPVHDPASFPATASRWWSWTAPADMTVDFSGPVAAVYRGDTLATLQAVGTDHTISGEMFHRFPAVGGTTYRIALIDRDGRPTFRLHARPSPAGDRFAAPEDLGEIVSTILTPDLADHTFEKGEPGPFYLNSTTHWWRWTAPRDGTVTLADSTGYWSLVTGSDLATASTIAGNADVPVTAGQSLRIRLHRSSNANGIFSFHPYEANDDFADAADLGTVDSATIALDPYHATTEASEPSPFPGYSDPGTLWWTWTAPADGILALAAEAESPFHSPLNARLFEGDSLGAMTPVRDSIYRPGHFAVLAGQSYRIRLAAATPRQSDLVTLDLALLPGVPNDHWVRAIDLGQTSSARGTGTLVDTTPEWFSPVTSQAGTAWWKWTAPADGTAFIHIDTATGTGSGNILVFDDPASGVPLALHRVGLNLAGPGFALPVSTGQSLWISVGVQFPSQQGPVDLTVHHLARPANDTPESAMPLVLDSPVTASFLGTIPGNGSDPTLWWEWTAPAGGLYELGIDSGAASVFVETSPGEWTLVADSTNGVLIWRADAGARHRIAAVAPSGAWPDQSLTLTATSPALNDHFADAAPLSGDWLEVRSHLVEATAEAGEPDHGGMPAVRSVWFAWTALETTHLSLRLDASQARIAVYSGDALGALTPLAHGANEARLPVAQGETYRIAVDGGAAEAFSLALRTFVPPPNDRLADRIVLSSAAPAFTGDLEFATTEPGEPAAVSASLWWEWTPAATGYFRVEAPPGSLVKLMRHEFPPGHPAFFIATQEMADGSFFQAWGGTRYVFHLRALVGLPPAGPGTFRFVPLDGSRFEVPQARPINDDFEDSIDLGNHAAVRSSAVPFAGITNQAGEPLPHSSYRALWWSWTAPASGFHEIPRTTPATQLIRVHTGDSLAGLTPATLNTGGDILQAEAGTTYHFQLLTRRWDSLFGATTEREYLTLGFEIRPPPTSAVNDNFAAALDLGMATGQNTAGHNLGATAEPGEPGHAGSPANRSVWYRWTAPESGPFEVTVIGAVMRAAVYTGNDIASLAEVASGVEPLAFTAVQGTNYLVALDSSLPERFSVRFQNLAPPPAPGPPVNDHFADAVALTGGPHTVPGSLRGATVESGEPLTHVNHLYSVWWAWTATTTGPVTFSATNVVLSASLGDSPATLVPVAGPATTIRFHASAGTTYRIAAAEYEDTRDFFLVIDPSIPPPPHDRFADALELSGPTVAADFQTAGASQEPGQPTPGTSPTARGVWASWTAPASGYFDLTVSSASTASHAIEVFTGESLGSLVSLGTASTRFRLPAIGGTRYTIALSTPVDGAVLSLDIRPTNRPLNDDFADRISLGQAVDIPVSGTTEDATSETGEHLASSGRTATVWWSWTAPATGRFALEILEGAPSVGIFTGSAPDDLTPVVTASSQTLIGFQAEAGTSYQISVSSPPTAGGPVAFVIQGTPPPNDNFADRIVLDSVPSLVFGGRTSLATREPGEPLFAGFFTGRTIWWEWTAPVDGAFDLIGAGSAHVFTGTTLSFLRPVPMTTPATGIRRFHAVAGVTYIIGFSGANRADLELRPARPLPPNDRFADAIALGGQSATSTSHNWGAGVDPGEPAGHTRSLWWTWTAPRDGSARVSTSGGNLHLYRGDSITALAPAGNPFSGPALYPVLAGDTFRIAVSAIHQPSEVSLNVEMTPPGDDFHAAVILPSFAPEPATVDLSKMGWEPLEPPHDGSPAEHSAWFRWTAPDGTPVTFDLTQSSGTRLAIYTGDQLTRLTPVAEGAGAVTFLPQRGETYRIAVDQTVGFPLGPVTLGVTQQLTGFAAWRAARFPDPNAAAAEPDADPDGDGRVNLLEMALGTDPLAPDAGPNAVRLRDFEGYVTVSVVRPASHDGLAYALEVTPGLDQPWHNAATMDRLEWITPLDDGMEEFHIQLLGVKTADHPGYFARLRVEIE